MESIKNTLRKVPFVVNIYRKIKYDGFSAAKTRAWLNRQQLEWKNRAQGGAPIPPGELMFLVAGNDDADWFLRSGGYGAQCLRDVLLKNGIRMEDLGSILDFGCGVGRVLRYWKDLKGPQIYGTDYNPKLIEWARVNLPFAQFNVNPLKGPLDYPAEKFDLIYALSVFTHLTEPQIFYWMEELCRIVKPGGYLFITTHGDFYKDQIPPEEKDKYVRGELALIGSDREGSNYCASFTSPAYVREKMARGLIVRDHIPEGAAGNPRQDVWLLQKPA